MTIQESQNGLSMGYNEGPSRLPEDVIVNLTEGKQLPVSRKPFLYHAAFIADVLDFVVWNEVGPFANPAFRENTRQFIETFKPKGRTLVSPRVPNRLFWGEYHPSFMKVEEIPPPDFRRKRIFFHGRFNGVPHPGYLETLLLLKKMAMDSNQQAELWIGVESDSLSINEGQVLFADPMFRASLFWATGLIDKLILLETSGKDEYKLDTYWDNLYAIDLEGLNPDIIFMLNDEKFERKFSQTSVRSAILTEQDLGNELMMHQTDLKEGRISVEEVRRRWGRLRELLKEI